MNRSEKHFLEPLKMGCRRREKKKENRVYFEKDRQKKKVKSEVGFNKG